MAFRHGHKPRRELEPRPHLTVIEGTSDTELLQSFVHGDHNAFTTIVKRYHDRLLRKAEALTKNRESAEDLVQQAFEELMRHAATLNGAALNTWLHRVVTNRAYNLFRDAKKHREKETVHPEQFTVGSHELQDPEQAIIDAQHREQLLEIINTLPPLYAEVLRLQIEEDLTPDEIAERLSVPSGTVRSRLNRGKTAVSKALEERGRTETNERIAG